FEKWYEVDILEHRWRVFPRQLAKNRGICAIDSHSVTANGLLALHADAALSGSFPRRKGAVAAVLCVCRSAVSEHEEPRPFADDVGGIHPRFLALDFVEGFVHG